MKEKDIQLIRDAIKDGLSGVLSPAAALIAIHSIVNPAEPDAEDIAWAKAWSGEYSVRIDPYFVLYGTETVRFNNLTEAQAEKIAKKAEEENLGIVHIEKQITFKDMEGK